MKYKITILLASIVITIGIALWKNSNMDAVDFDTVYDSVETISYGVPLNIFSENELATMHYDRDSSTLDELYDKADVVAIIKPVSRKQEVSIVNTKARIEKTLKSDLKKGDEIFVFEQFHLQYLNESDRFYADLLADAGYIPMNMEKEYLVFLKKSEGYQHNQFGYVSLLYNKFPIITENAKILEIDCFPYGGERYSLDKIFEYDIVLFNILNDAENPTDEETEKEIENYIKYKKNYLDLLKKLKNNDYEIFE